ncbi:MAG: SUMF1/EgtB/PvdO family nonheme iron enzyme [Bacteroidota bacterium]
MRKVLYLLCNVCWFVGWSNNLVISNGAISEVNTMLDYAVLSFDISWENSWRDAENWDAIWIFLKYNDGTEWHHAELNYIDGANDGHTAPAGAAITTPPDGKGVFLYRSAIGSGHLTLNNVLVRWNYGTDGLADLAGVNVQIMGIEMVYVPEGSFWLGDGETTDVQGHFEAGTSGAAFEVTSDAAITLGGGASGSLGNNNGAGMSNNGDFIPAPYNTISMDDFNDATVQTLPADFPKGFRGFYCMKYELTQGEYTAFVNMLTSTQAATRFDSNPHSVDESTVRYTFTGTHPNLEADFPHIPAIFVEYFDGAAYADWAGLRPMTELEFEKATRGFALPVVGEYAWGTTNLNADFPTVSNPGATDEAITANFNTSAGNAWYNNVNAFGACIRVGVFAANPANTGRETSGATYWGIMEMSGNAWERAVTVGRPEGRAFEGSHGDGELNAEGNATNTDWPGHSGANGVDDVIGVGYRGAGFAFPNPVTSNMRISARRLATSFYNIRYFDDTMRMVRTSPH